MKSRNTTANYPGRPSVNISVALIALGIVTVGCTGTQGVQEQEQDPATVYVPSRQEPRTLANSLLNTKWKAMSILGKPAGSADSTVEFRADGTVTGNGGCNGYQGGVTLDGNAIEFGMLATTRMMCAPPVSGQEIVFLEALGMARSGEQSDDILELFDAGNEIVLQLTRQ
jgi:heat shock protein HslJ